MDPMQTWNLFVFGFSASAALIIAIGAQNAFVLRQGLRGEHVPLVVLICALSDAMLIQAGVWGVGAAVAALPAVDTAVRLFGAAFLIGYAVIAARRAMKPAALVAAQPGSGGRAAAAAVTAMALTWLNPHVYLDTVLLLGAIASPLAQAERGWFAAGATAASIGWFSALGFGARWLRPWLATPRAWRALDALIALIMLGIALSLLRGLG